MHCGSWSATFSGRPRRFTQSRTRLVTRPLTSRHGKPGNVSPVLALFGRKSRKQRKEELKLLEDNLIITDRETKDELLSEDLETDVTARADVESPLESCSDQEQVTEDTVIVPVPEQQPLEINVFQPRHLGAFVFGSAVVGFTAYVIYLWANRNWSVDGDEMRLNVDDIMQQVKRLKEIRMEPDLSESDVIRVRSYLLSLIIKQKNPDPVEVINKVLRLLNEKLLTDAEKEVILDTSPKIRPQAEKETTEEPPVAENLTGKQSQFSSTAVPRISAAFHPDANVLWWHKLPYICILQMKESRALYMTAIPKIDPNGFALLGFEDPEEAFHAGKMPAQKQLWGHLPTIGAGDSTPSPPVNNERHFDLTWVHPKEFNDLMILGKCYGLVIPAGTLRTPKYQGTIPVSLIKPSIDYIAASKKIGPTKAVIQTLKVRPEDEPKAEDSVPAEPPAKTTEPSPKTSETPANDQSAQKTATKQEMDSLVKELGLEDKPTQDSETVEAEDRPETLNGTANGFRTKSIPPEDMLDSYQVNGMRDDLDWTRTADADDSIFNEDGTTTPKGMANTPLWWLELDKIFIPLIKTPNDNGGCVEINISNEPKKTEFRLILFEDAEEAKGFLGVVGTLYGPDTLVAVKEQPPREFIMQNPGLDIKRIAMLCTGALLLEKEVDRNGIRHIVRFALIATEMKKGFRPKAPEGVQFSERKYKIAQKLVNNVHNRSKHNKDTNSKMGDADYQDPGEGFIDDFSKECLFDIFAPKTSPGDEDGTSAEEDDDELDYGIPKLKYNHLEESMGGPYEEFVAKMAAQISRPQSTVQNDETPPSTKATEQTEETEIETSLDDLITEEEEKERKRKEEDEGFEIYYPKANRSGKPHRQGRYWFEDIKVVYLPELLRSDGSSTALATEHPKTGKGLIIGFQAMNDAQACVKMIGSWPGPENVASRIATVSSNILTEMCREHNADPVVVRQSAIPLSVDMSQMTFFTHVVLIADVQGTQYPIFSP